GAAACAPPRTRRAVPAGLGSSARPTPCSSIARGGATATTTHPGSSTRRSESSSTSAPSASPRRGSSLRDDCLFCRLVREGNHFRATDGFVAVRDIHPKADVHLLVLRERHVDTFREVSEF